MLECVKFWRSDRSWKELPLRAAAGACEAVAIRRARETMADFAAAQPQPPQLPAGWQPNLLRIISDIVPMLSAEQRQAFREFMKGLKAKRDAREIPSLSVALMEQAPSVVGPELWQLCIDRQRMGTLFIACWEGHVDAARLLLEKGAEVDRANKKGATPLYAACFKGHVDVAQLLLDKGAEVDRAKEGGWTPLLVACGKGHVAVALLCLERGAEVDRALEDGKTPLDIAKHHRHDAVVALLGDHLYKADIDATAPVATQWRGKNMANMLAGKQRALASKKRALQERDEALKQATKRVARVEKERDDHESRGELLDSMVSPLESQRRELQEIVGAAAKALINRGVPTRMLSDDDTPFYYARNSWDTEQRVPWNVEADRPMSLAEGIAWLIDEEPEE